MLIPLHGWNTPRGVQVHIPYIFIRVFCPLSGISILRGKLVSALRPNIYHLSIHLWCDLHDDTGLKVPSAGDRRHFENNTVAFLKLEPESA